MAEQRLATEFSQETESILRQSKAMLDNDHFVYISGDHGSGWINKDALLPDLQKVSRLAKLMAEATRNVDKEIICGPAIGGLIMAQWVAYHCGLPAVFTEHGKAADSLMRPEFAIKRGFENLIAGKKVMIVDDVVNTGYSIKKTAEVVRHWGGEVVGAAAYCSRGNAYASELSVPQYIYLFEYLIPDWPGTSCPLCAKNMPVNTEYAHGKDFVDALAERIAHK